MSVNNNDKTNVLVLGCGMVGATMARDLARREGFHVTVADVSEASLARLANEPSVNPLCTDLSDPSKLSELVSRFDFVAGAMPSRFGYSTLRTVIEAGKPMSDISFMPENALELDQLAKERGVTAVVDCGVSPGLSNLFVGHAAAKLDEAHEAVIYVGGLPRKRTWPYQYKAPFAPSDVIEEYTRPARLREAGQTVTRPALSEPEFLDFEEVGTLEAVNTDGLRSLLFTVDIPTMREKTLRYPGHCDLMRAFAAAGLFSEDSIEVNGTRISPRAVTSHLMFKDWAFEPKEEEFTLLRVEVTGQRSGKPIRMTYNLYDQYCRETDTQSMARTTAFPNTAMIAMLADGTFQKPGVHAPETLGSHDALFTRMLTELEARGVRIVLEDVQ